jgi:hypothetical protein
VSVIQYAKEADLKADLNEKFKERHPEVDITLRHVLLGRPRRG